jgi:NAD(P)-dependent dehydrogenase (short-subunit alcohol dehydrogenase family)
VAAGGGAVVNMSSLAAQQFFTPRRHEELASASLSYYAAKSGIDGLTRYMAGVGGKNNIRVNGVRPGLMNRDRQAGEGGRVRDDQIIPGPGYGEDVAYLVLFLACDESRFITAQIINVDGGVSGHI